MTSDLSGGDDQTIPAAADSWLPSWSGSAPGRVMLVCTANRARSPFAHLLLQHQLAVRGAAGLIQVVSSGVTTVSGLPMDPRMAKALEERGVSTEQFVSHSFHDIDLSTIDLALTSTRAQRGALVRRAPALLSRAFTMAQSTRLLGLKAVDVTGADDPQTTLAHLVGTMAERRGQSGPSAGDADDIDDPWQRPEKVYLRVIEELTGTVDVLTNALVTSLGLNAPGSPHGAPEVLSSSATDAT